MAKRLNPATQASLLFPEKLDLDVPKGTAVGTGGADSALALDAHR
jgi:hypothetical protein